MKLWRLKYLHDHAPSGSSSEWFTNKRDAARRLRELEQEPRDVFEQGYQGNATIDQYAVPTTKAALAEWLTRYEP